tara:strand:- start:1292 stop:1993 length:702 start_codon:yes stop_codon:yes gene_type:complete
MKYDKAFVIGSKKLSENRLKRFYSKNKLKDIEITLWPAIIGTEVDINHYKKEKFLTDDFKINLIGSLGCLLSHATLWKNCAEDQNCNIALIFEDDAIIKEDFNMQVEQIKESDLPKDWTILRLSYKGLKGKPISETVVKPDSIKKKGVNAGTWCYLLNTKNVQTLFDIILPYNNKNSMDVVMRNNMEELKIYFSKYNHAIHYEKNYSPRKDLNLQKKNLFQMIKFSFRKFFKN